LNDSSDRKQSDASDGSEAPLVRELKPRAGIGGGGLSAMLDRLNSSERSRGDGSGDGSNDESETSARDKRDTGLDMTGVSTRHLLDRFDSSERSRSDISCGGSNDGSEASETEKRDTSFDMMGVSKRYPPHKPKKENSTRNEERVSMFGNASVHLQSAVQRSRLSVLGIDPLLGCFDGRIQVDMWVALANGNLSHLESILDEYDSQKVPCCMDSSEDEGESSDEGIANDQLVSTSSSSKDDEEVVGNSNGNEASDDSESEGVKYGFYHSENIRSPKKVFRNYGSKNTLYTQLADEVNSEGGSMIYDYAAGDIDGFSFKCSIASIQRHMAKVLQHFFFLHV
jgi:hypothetical protein